MTPRWEQAREMTTVREFIDPARGRTTSREPLGPDDRELDRPLVSLVVPAYNEGTIVQPHLAALCGYMERLESEYRWEIVFVNDGSTDETGKQAEEFARTRPNVRVLHHRHNFGMGQAFKFAFQHCRGDYVVTLDLDLTYAPGHIETLLSRLRETGAKVVVASPYMDGGRISNVPWLRRVLSVWANRFLSLMVKGHLSTLTGMVRAYDGPFLRTLSLRSLDGEINPEIIYKATLLKADIREVPGHLDWGEQQPDRVRRRTRITAKMVRHTLAVMLSGFLFRPVMFFILPGLALLAFSLFASSWAFIHFLDHYRVLTQYPDFSRRASAAMAAAFALSPHTFVVGGIAGMLAVQLMSLGILALQSKSYFEEIFHLGTTMYKSVRAQREADRG
jgi:glycosyltransferase involved in cell wall biosynthesis